MNINPISFKGTYCIQQQHLSGKSIKKLYDKEDEYLFTTISSNSNAQKYLYINVDDSLDKKFERFLKKIKLPFTKMDKDEVLSLQNIKSRMILNKQTPENNPQLVEIDAEKLNSELAKDKDFYVGYNASNGSKEKYANFKKYLETNQPIKSPIIYLKVNAQGEITTHVYDGRHRLSVLRDLGMNKIPVTIDEESIELAKEIGLI